MTKNNYLKRFSDILTKQGYYINFRDKNVLDVAYTDKDMPFMFVIVDEISFPGFIAQTAVNYVNVPEAIDLTVQMMYIAPVALGESFYFTKDGSCYFGDDAWRFFELENTNINNMEVTSKAYH